MDGWSTDFPLLPTDRAPAPDLDIDSLLDFASQSLLQPVFEQPGALKTPPLSFHDDGLHMPFIALPIHRGPSFTGRKHDFPTDLLSSPSAQVQELDARQSWAAIGEARSSSEDDKHDTSHHNSRGVDTSIHMLREKNRRAQRKFREKQKQKLADSEGQATVLRRELEQLRIEKSRLETRNGLLEKLVSMKGGGALSMFSDLDTALEAEAAHAKEASQTILLTVKRGAPQNISLDELKGLPYPKLTRLWKEYVEEMRKALDQAAGDETTTAGKRVVSLIEELRMVLTCLMSANPLGMQSLRALKMDPDGAGSTMELPPPELHERLLQEIVLSPKQRQAAVAYRNHLLSRMGATLRQRRDISLQLLRTLGAQQPSSGKQMARGTVLAQGQMAATRAADELRNNIRDEQELYNQFLMAVRSLLTPIQSAIAISQAWPWFPDALSLFNTVAKEEGAPGEQELLACPTPDSLPGLPNLTAAPPTSLLVVQHTAL